MSQHKVIVYTSNQCSQCEKVIKKLSEWNIDFEERNISDDRTYFKELQSQNVYGTPATFINDEKVLGYQERKLKRTLGIQDTGRFHQLNHLNFS
ncbi:glutaredoxin family protein [Halobacillus sp. Marseille-Q1614]|uniref:glutaredoxin family protein n=1 Tax=Halobacillus sp. Marseille-Q1614 TaxID=2709134 RepID=UPI00156E3D2B|nr:glutaredoxin family protein [Halobacillus sp. Marseille-Q1614]